MPIRLGFLGRPKTGWLPGAAVREHWVMKKNRPPEAVALTLDALLSATRRRVGDRAVLRAMARRERAIDGVFPVF